MSNSIVENFVSENTKDWSLESWLSIKDKLKDCIWVEGSFLKHPQLGFVYFAPQPSEIGTLYQIQVKDIVDAQPTDKIVKKFDSEYKVVRIYLKRDLVLLKLDWCLAADLPEYFNVLRNRADDAAKNIASSSVIDQASLDSKLSSLLSEGGFNSVRETREGRGGDLRPGGGSGGGGGDRDRGRGGNDGGGGGRSGASGVRG